MGPREDPERTLKVYANPAGGLARSIERELEDNIRLVYPIGGAG
jgi:hypothetical protein